MNKLVSLLHYKKKNILSIYFTAGYPAMSDTTEILTSLQEAGADLAEIGFPFSDPMADGPVIQRSSYIALQNGMNLDILFNQLESIKNGVKIPIVLMGYLNPAFKYGMERFCRRCSESGVSGLIIPDLPYEVYIEKYADIFNRYDLCYIPLITPQTSDKRAVMLASAAKGFIYIVSSTNITGGKANIEDHSAYFLHIRELIPDKPLLIGFGIHDAVTFANACKSANGAIIGTAFIKSLGLDSGKEYTQIRQFTESIRVPV